MRNNYYRDQLLSFEEGEVEWKMLGDIGENLDSKRKPITSGLREARSIPYYGASGIVDYVKDYIFDGDFLLISEDGVNLLARNTPIAFSISGKSWVNAFGWQPSSPLLQMKSKAPLVILLTKALIPAR